MSDDLSRHQLHYGASGVRAACAVCRLVDPPVGWGERIDFTKPCQPSAEALDKFEAATRDRIARATADLEHAAAHRAALLVRTSEGALS